jgi:hypothetical protein
MRQLQSEFEGRRIAAIAKTASNPGGRTSANSGVRCWRYHLTSIVPRGHDPGVDRNGGGVNETCDPADCLVLSWFSLPSPTQATTLDPKALAYDLPSQIPWKARDGGSEEAILAGDPDKPGLYVVLEALCRRTWPKEDEGPDD